MAAQDVFIKLGRPDTERVLADINPALEGIAFDPAAVTILAHTPSFYPGFRFLEISDFGNMPAVQRFVLHKPGTTAVLNGTNEPVYRLNRDAPITLSPDTVGAYVRFFFTHVRGRQGRFIIAETIEDIAWKEEPPAAARKAVGQLLQPLHVQGPGPDGGYRIVAHMVFKDALFKTAITVAADGLVTLGDEELLIEDMPVLDDTLGQ
jgi:hypothetical protein